MYLLDAPHMVATLPAGATTIRTAIPAEASAATGAFSPPHWSLPSPDLTEFRVTLRLHIDVQGFVANPDSDGCFWHIAFHFEDRSFLDGGSGLSSHCIGEAAIVATGTRVLELETSTASFDPSGGERLAFTIYSIGYYAPGATVDLLSGTIDADSSWTIEGLQLPLDTRTLLV